MRRKLFNLIGAASLILSLVVLFFWLRTRTQELVVLIQNRSPRVSIYDLRAPIAIPAGTWRIYLISWAGSLELRRNNVAGSLVAQVPYWALFAALLVPPIVRQRYLGALLRRRRARMRAGCCPACGYDLRASPDRCPECGAVPQPPHNPPMQRTGASGIVFVVRALQGRGSGR
jgi:hypothetical protein